MLFASLAVMVADCEIMDQKIFLARAALVMGILVHAVFAILYRLFGLSMLGLSALIGNQVGCVPASGVQRSARPTFLGSKLCFNADPHLNPLPPGRGLSLILLLVA